MVKAGPADPQMFGMKRSAGYGLNDLYRRTIERHCNSCAEGRTAAAERAVGFVHFEDPERHAQIRVVSRHRGL